MDMVQVRIPTEKARPRKNSAVPPPLPRSQPPPLPLKTTTLPKGKLTPPPFPQSKTLKIVDEELEEEIKKEANPHLKNLKLLAKRVNYTLDLIRELRARPFNERNKYHLEKILEPLIIRFEYFTSLLEKDPSLAPPSFSKKLDLLSKHLKTTLSLCQSSIKHPEDQEIIFERAEGYRKSFLKSIDEQKILAFFESLEKDLRRKIILYRK